MGNDFATPALYFFSTVAQTMGAIIAIVLASVYAIIPQIQQRNDNSHSPVLLRLLQKDSFFINSVVSGFSAIITSLGSIFIIYITGINNIFSITIISILGIISSTLFILSSVNIWLFITKRVKIYSTINDFIDNEKELGKKYILDNFVDYVYANILYYSNNTDNLNKLIDANNLYWEDYIKRYGIESFYFELVKKYLNDSRTFQNKNENVLFVYFAVIYFLNANIGVNSYNRYVLTLLDFFKLNVSAINQILWKLHRYNIEKINILNEKSFISNRLLLQSSIIKYYAIESQQYSTAIFDILQDSPCKIIINEALRLGMQEKITTLLNLVVYIWILFLASESTLINNSIISNFAETTSKIIKNANPYLEHNLLTFFKDIENEKDSLFKFKQILSLSVLCHEFDLSKPTNLITNNINITFLIRKYSFERFEFTIDSITKNINRIRELFNKELITTKEIYDFLNYHPFDNENN